MPLSLLRRLLISLCALFATVALAQASHAQESAEELLAATRVALFGESGRAPDKFISYSGPAKGFGMEFEGEAAIDTNGRYRIGFQGAFQQAMTHDGSGTWELTPTGIVQELSEGGERSQLLMCWFLTGHWLQPSSGVSVTLDQEQSTSRRFVLKVDAGLNATGEVVVDRKTFLPRHLEVDKFGRKMRMIVDWGTKLDALTLPQRMRLTDAGKTSLDWSITAARYLDAEPDFGRPQDLLEVVYDPAIKPQLEVRKASGGHLWVRPKVHGKDLGWFLFDTGASGSILDDDVAEQLGLQAIGKVNSTGIGGVQQVDVVRVESLSLAGVEVRDLVATTRDLSGSERSMGIKIAGYLGVDILGKGVIVYDEKNVAIEFHVPSAFELEGAEWEVMPVHSGKPCWKLEYEGHQGLFLIDTGAPGRLIVSPFAVERNRLLEDRKTNSSRAYGSGGSVKARNGTVDRVKWGGAIFDKVRTTFITEEKGAGADRQRDGIIGADLLRKFVVVFDVSGKRIAFLPHAR